MASVSVLPEPARRLEGKVALITGGSRGIGECTARLFFKHGAKVVIADILDDLGHAVCKEINSESFSYVHCDVSKEADVENAVNTAVSRYGKLDVMFNNAGIVGVVKTNMLDITQDEFEQVIKVNVTGTFLGTKHAARVMIPNRKGSIISACSICASVGGFASHAYTSSKHGVLGIVRSTAVELGNHGIRVNAVSPYIVESDMSKHFLKLDDEGFKNVYSNLKGKVLQAQDVADAVLFLASDDAKYVSGHNLSVDGGFIIVNNGFNMYGNASQ